MPLFFKKSNTWERTRWLRCANLLSAQLYPWKPTLPLPSSSPTQINPACSSTHSPWGGQVSRTENAGCVHCLLKFLFLYIFLY